MNAPPALTALAETAIRSCLGSTALVTGDGETAEVARLVLQLPAALVQAWSPMLAAGELDVVGVFSHKTPRARWTDPRTARSCEPELCDLLLVLDCEDLEGRTKRALVIQAKTASSGTAGQFSIDAGEPERQRYLYAHWPPFHLTGLGKPAGPYFQITPQPPGSCPGTRYACVNVAAPLPSCGWWVEDSQPKIAPSGVYHGTQNATLPLGEALRRMVAGTLGAPLVAGSEWERLELHLEAVANHRQASFRPPPDVKATASGTLLPHMAAASLFMVDAPKFFDSKARSGYGPRYAGLNDHPQPPDGEQPHLVLDEQSPGFGVIYLRLVFPQWRDGERTRSQD